MIRDEMLHHAQRLIAKDSLAAYRLANPKPISGTKRPKPYRSPMRADLLVEALNTGNEENVSRVLLDHFTHDLSGYELR